MKNDEFRKSIYRLYFINFYSKRIVVKIIFKNRIDIRNDFLYGMEYICYGHIN